MGRVLVVALVVAMLISTALEVAASTPQDVMIVQHTSRGCVTPCTFVATGAVNDSGLVTLDSFHASALPSPVVGTGHFIRTYHGQSGALTIQLQTLLTATDVPLLWHESGHWVLVEATGAYFGLHGEGVESGTRNFATNTLDVIFTGQMH